MSRFYWYAECSYTEFRYAECQVFIVMLSVILMSIVMLSVIMLCVVMLIAVVPSEVYLNYILRTKSRGCAKKLFNTVIFNLQVLR